MPISTTGKMVAQWMNKARQSCSFIDSLHPLQKTLQKKIEEAVSKQISFDAASYRFIDSSRVRLRQGFEKYLTSGAKYLSWLLIPPHSRCDKWWLFHSVYSFNGRQIVLLDDQDYRSCEFSVEVFVLWTCGKVVREVVVGKDALHRLIAEENGSEFLR